MSLGRSIFAAVGLALALSACEQPTSVAVDDHILAANARAAKVAVCHIPPGNPANAHIIEVAESAVPAHLAHGDVLAVCSGTGPTPPLAFRREDDQSGDDWLYLLDPDTGVETLLLQANVGLFSMAPDQSRIVYNDEDVDAWNVLEFSTGAISTVFDGAESGSPETASWSPDLTQIVLEDFDVIFTVDRADLSADTLNLILPIGFVVGQFPFSEVTWSPDGTEIAFTCRSDEVGVVRTICSVDLATDAVRYLRTQAAGTSAAEPAWSPDGEWVAFTNGDEILIIRPDGTDEQTVFLRGGYDDVTDPTWSPDGTQLAFECDDPITGIHICFGTVASGVVTESVLGKNPAWAN